ncbi:M3 family metallopeptidase [Caulobacter hibisci]|uniref:M3 family metallopeptidase n=1 Tax=Caulobacter hibisci TaxID=2035993 RepID=A0ABS0SX34_9CAUL|nr:M3 family metallopeptidase [Caulobacter hibisci]
MQRRTFLLSTAAAAAASAAAPALSFAAETNPLLAPWTGPYGGVPAFDKMKVSDLTAAVDTAIARNLAEVDAIAANKDKPTFANTIAALEDTGRTLADVGCYYGIWGSNMSSPEYQAIEPAIDAKFSEIGDKITQNAALFARIEAVYNSPEKAKLTAEQQRLVWIYYTNFVRSGAKLAPAAKARVAAINTELSGLFTKFSQNLLADEETYIELTEADLAGLPDAIKGATASSAEQRKLPGKNIIVNTRSSVDPYLTNSPVRATREKVWKAFVNRGDNGGATDNNALIAKILKLRAERAKLLGFATHAHWRLENAMAKTPDKAMALMEAVWTPAIAQVAKDVADMQAIVDAEGGGFKIEPWDYRYYAEKVRKAKYDLDMNEVKPYMQLEKLREGMFWAAGQVYGFEFKKVDGLPVYHPTMTVYEVVRDGKHVGLWYFDPYARQGKRSGAWMNAYRNQERFKKPISTIVSNNSNFIEGKPGEPVLISWDDANTLFHEFGHAIHGLNSDVTYPTVSGTNVARDYVEFPSQLNEHWLSTPEVLNKFCVHYKTGEPIPQALVDKIKKASTFNQGFDTTEYLASALIDMKLHLAGGVDIDPDKFEREELAKLNMPKEIVMRHRTPQFGHVFSGDGYSAGYYSYLWADTLTADVAEAFQEAPGGFYDKPTGQRLIKTIMSKGNSVDPAEQFRAFRGRDVKIGALMRDRGFPVPPGA